MDLNWFCSLSTYEMMRVLQVCSKGVGNMKDFRWQRQDLQKNSDVYWWLIINENCMTKFSSYTGVEEFKCAMNNLSEHCWRICSTMKTVWLGIHSSEQRKYVIRWIFSWNKYWRNYMIAQWSSCVLKPNVFKYWWTCWSQRLGFWERSTFSHSDRSLDSWTEKTKHFRCTFGRMLKPSL